MTVQTADMLEAIARVPTAARVEALELRVSDLSLSVLELANVVEQLVTSTHNQRGGAGTKSMLTAIDNARALATPESDDDPEPEPPAAGARLRRYGIDLKSGEITDTDDLAEAREMYFSGSVLNILDRESGVLLVYRGRLDAPTLLLAAEAA